MTKTTTQTNLENMLANSATACSVCHEYKQKLLERIERTYRAEQKFQRDEVTPQFLLSRLSLESAVSRRFMLHLLHEHDL